jgi:hypothetical protein
VLEKSHEMLWEALEGVVGTSIKKDIQKRNLFQTNLIA